jgi:ABC-2 type transport system permease protein
MSLRRVGILLYRELVQGPKNFILIFAVVVPLVLSLVLSLLFGTLFAGKPRLGIVDDGDSQFTRSAAAMQSFTVREYASETGLREAAETGAVDIGVTLPADFDARVQNGQTTAMVAYIWGESLMKNRAMLVAAMTTWVRTIAGQRSPVEIVTTVLGDAAALSWQARLLPFIVLMALVFGGVMLPASSLVTEKQHRTLTAVSITPATMGDIYAAKGVMAVAISTTMALVTLALNRALGNNTILLIGVLVLGAIMAAEFGVLLGMWVKDVNSLFATIKSIGILLYAPALIYMFPAIPQWIAKFFPTNYIIEPVIEVAQRGASLADVAWQLAVLVALIVALAVGLAVLTRRRQGQE